MAQATVQTDRRTVKATGIVERQEVIPVDDLPGLYHVSDTATGSGQIYTTSRGRCDCADFRQRGRECKHMIAVQAEELALAQFCAEWNAHSEQVRAAAEPSCPSCGSALQALEYYIDGRWHQTFLICVDDATHAALNTSMHALPSSAGAEGGA